MQKHPRSLLALALACSVAACQPGSTPVQSQSPQNSDDQIQRNLASIIPAPRQQALEKPFDIKWASPSYSYHHNKSMACYESHFSSQDELACYLSGVGTYNVIYDCETETCYTACSGDPPQSDLSCCNPELEECNTEDDNDDDDDKCKGICKIAGGGKNGLLSLELSTDYFSPNGDGVKDSVDITIEDPEDEGWTLEVSGGGGVIGSGTGNSTLTWDGGGQPEGKYNVVLKAKGKNIKLPLVLDVTPPVITYNQVNQPNGRSVFQVNIEDNLSGLDPDSTGVDLQGLEVTTLQEKINKRTANFKYQILPQFEDSPTPET